MYIISNIFFSGSRSFLHAFVMRFFFFFEQNDEHLNSDEHSSHRDTSPWGSLKIPVRVYFRCRDLQIPAGILTIVMQQFLGHYIV